MTNIKPISNMKKANEENPMFSWDESADEMPVNKLPPVAMPASTTAPATVAVSVTTTTVKAVITGSESGVDAFAAQAESKTASANANVQAALNAIAEIDASTGLAELEMGAARVHVDDKRMINCRADVNQLVPFKYDWSWQKYLDACANHWMPQEINMAKDVQIWKSKDGLTEDERLVIMRNLGFFSTAFEVDCKWLVEAGSRRQ